MITILICALIAMSRGIYKAHQERDDYTFGGEYLFMGFISFLAGAFIGTIIAFALPMRLNENVEYYKIQNLSDGSSINGSFFLGTGRVNERMKYSLYYGDDQFQLLQIDCRDAVIQYSDSPRLLKIYKVGNGDLINYFALDNGFTKDRYVIEIPEGSIKNNFNLDAQ